MKSCQRMSFRAWIFHDTCSGRIPPWCLICRRHHRHHHRVSGLNLELRTDHLMMIVMLLGCSRVEIIGNLMRMLCHHSSILRIAAQQWEQEVHDEHGRHLMTQFSGFATAMSSDQERGLRQGDWKPRIGGLGRCSKCVQDRLISDVTNYIYNYIYI